jgi:cytochrome P450
MLDEIDDGFNKQLGDTKEGKEVKAMAFFGRVAHQTACRIMIGPELCRDEDFLNSTTGLLESIFGTAIVIVTLPLGPLRGVLSYLFTLPHRWKLQQCAKMLKPVVAARIQNRIDPKGDQLKNYIPDAIDWAIEQGGNDPQANDVDNLTKELLHNLWAASSAPGGLMTQIVYQLCFEPHYREPLKKEAEAAIAEHGWSEKTFSKLHLQDSFIREINRLYPTGSGTATHFKFCK